MNLMSVIVIQLIRYQCVLKYIYMWSWYPNYLTDGPRKLWLTSPDFVTF